MSSGLDQHQRCRAASGSSQQQFAAHARLPVSRAPSSLLGYCYTERLGTHTLFAATFAVTYRKPLHNTTMSDRAHHDGSAGRAYTVEQKAAVLRIKKCAPTAYYEILGLEEVKKTCTDSEIKKAYRKLSLLTHPDKNGYAGADEAFKLVSKAFQVLSDPDKKSKFDQFGGDPDARFNPAAAGAGGSPFSGFAGQRGGGFQEEMTPEELFRQFFGGGFGAPFGRSKCHTHVGRGRGRSGLM